MDDESDRQQVTIAIVPGSNGPEFDRELVYLPVGAATVWVNHTATPQVILPDREGTRRVMRLAPAGQEGAVWMMQLRSSRRPVAVCNMFGWRLQGDETAQITIVTTGDATGQTE